MKFILSASLSLLSSVVALPAFAVDVSGHFFYKMPSGELVVRDATLDVPPRGQGKVVLKYKDGSIESDKFRHRSEHGRVTFEVLFMNPPGAPANTALVLTGAYMRGSNGVIYYGDSYTKVGTSDEDGSELGNLFERSQSFEARTGWTYSGGFEFNTLN